LWSLAGAPLDSPSARFLEACGFARRSREYHYQVGVESLLADIGPIAERFRARGHIPAAAEILSLSEDDAPLDEIAWLVSRELDSNPLVNAQNLRRRREDHADRSLFARLEGELAGVLLWRIVDGVAVVDARVVSKRRRSGWANLAMLEKALKRGQTESLQHIHFFCDEAIHDTISLAQRGEGEEFDVKGRYFLDFGGISG
jgi:hypothetical protein